MKAVPANVPGVGAPRAIKVPVHAERKLRNGLRVIALRKPGVPRVEIALRLRAGLVFDGGDGARARLLPETLMSGTRSLSAVEIARELQSLGASLTARADVDDLIVGAGGLSSNLGGLLDLMSDIVTAPAFPKDEVAVASARAAQEIIINLSQPQVVANQALRARLYGKHRYGRGFPDPAKVRALTPASLRSFHSKFVGPRGGQMVLVGDIHPERTLDRVEEAFKGWKAPAQTAPPAPGALPTGLPALIVDRPGSVQTSVRIAGPALSRSHPDFYKLALANMVFGGYFSSRLVNNIREDKGYTYSPGSLIEHRRAGSLLQIVADVGTEVTAASLLEIHYELGRLTALPVPEDELHAARSYLAGVTLLQILSQAGLAAYVDAILAAGVDLDYLTGFRKRLDSVTVDDIGEAALRYLSPRNLTTVLVGDAKKIAGSVEALQPVEVAKGV